MTQRSGKTEPRAAPSCEKQAVNNVCVLSILYSNWLRQGHGAGCRSQPSFPKPFAQSLGLSKGPSCKLGCRVAPPTMETSGLAAAVRIAWGEGTTWQRSIQVLEGL